MEFLMPDELILSITEVVQHRDILIWQLASLLAPGLLGPPTVIVHGVEATGKSLTINAILGVLDTPSAVIKSQECITARHLLERALTATSECLSSHGPSQDIDGRCENISAFVVQLQHLLQNQQKFILVFDGIDRQRECPPTLIPALVRLGEI
ncbi:MAG: hypothetical protein Q9190_007802, partial [Brigantiaea leucoxantha]